MVLKDFKRLIIKLKKAQASTEYIFLLGIILVILIPSVLYSFTKTNQEIKSDQLEELAGRIKRSANAVYTLGEGSQEIITVSVPSNVFSVTFNNRKEFVINMDSPLQAGTAASDIGVSTLPYLIGNMTTEPGAHRLLVYAFNSTHVNITDIALIQ